MTQADKFLAEWKAKLAAATCPSCDKGKPDNECTCAVAVATDAPQALTDFIFDEAAGDRLVAMVEAARDALAEIACCHGDVPGEGHRTYDRTDMHMRARRAEAELDCIAGGGAP